MKLQPPSSAQEACRAGVQAEIENIAMYDRLLRETNEPEVRALFQRLQAKSRDARLPVVERCVAWGGEAGNGTGPGMRRQPTSGAGHANRTRRRGRVA